MCLHLINGVPCDERRMQIMDCGGQIFSQDFLFYLLIFEEKCSCQNLYLSYYSCGQNLNILYCLNLIILYFL